MDDARRGAFNVVVAWRFDRFARSVKQLVLALEEFRSLEIDFISHQEALDTSTPMGKAVFTIIAAMAELERNLIRERVTAGLEYARAHGTKSGKPVGWPRRVFDHERVADLYSQGKTPRQIAAQLGLGEGTVRRVLRTGVRLGTAAPKPIAGGGMSDADSKRPPPGSTGAQETGVYGASLRGAAAAPDPAKGAPAVSEPRCAVAT